MAYQSEIGKLEQRFREKPEQWFAALADAYRKNGDLELALEILTTWIDKRPTYTSGHIVQGRCLLDKGDDAQAAGVFRKVLDLDPENIIALKSLGEIAQRSDDSAGAREWLTMLLDVDPMNEEAQEALEALGGPAEPPAPEVAAPAVPSPPPAPSPEAEPAAPAEAIISPMGLEPTQQFEGSSEPPAPTESEATVAESEPPAPMGFEPTVPEVAPVEKTEAEEDEYVVIGEPAHEPAPFDLVETGPTESDSADESAELATRDDEADEPPISLVPEPFAEESGAQHLDVESFDEDLGWDEGERQSKRITEDDVAAAAASHDEGLEEAAVQELPGMEAEQIPSAEDEIGEVGPTEDVVVVGETVVGEDSADEPASADAEPGFVTESASVSDELAASVPEPEPVEPAITEEQPLDLILPDDVAPKAEEPAPVVTATMADLYVQQGLYEQARDLYGQLLELDPGNADLATKLSDLEGKANAPVHAEAPPAPEQRFSIAITGGQSVRDMLLAIAGAAQEDRPSHPKPRVQPPAMPSSGSAGGGAGSFDQFFGNPSEPAAEPTADPGGADPNEPGRGDDKAFQSWLKDLKT